MGCVGLGLPPLAFVGRGPGSFTWMSMNRRVMQAMTSGRPVLKHGIGPPIVRRVDSCVGPPELWMGWCRRSDSTSVTALACIERHGRQFQVRQMALGGIGLH